MKHLHFEGIYKDLLKSGKKRLTIRITKPKIKKGDLVLFHSGGKVIGKFKITNIYTKKLYQITDAEAIKDGHISKEELLRAIKKHYPRIKDNKEVVIIEFEPVEIFEDELSSEEFAWKDINIDPIELAKLALKYDDKLSNKQKKYLEILIQEGSFRKAAIRLGNLNKRPIFRKILKASYYRLKSKGIII